MFLFQEEEGEIYYVVKIWLDTSLDTSQLHCIICCMKLVGEMETVEVNRMCLL